MRILLYSLVGLLLATSCSNTKQKTTSDDETTEETKPHKTRKPAVEDEEGSKDETDAGWTSAQKKQAVKWLMPVVDPEDVKDNFQHNSKDLVTEAISCAVEKAQDIMSFSDFSAIMLVSDTDNNKLEADLKAKKKKLEGFFESCAGKYNLEK